jgi:hypothetical protein
MSINSDSTKRHEGTTLQEYNDLNVEMWAYGACITDGQGGSDNASKLSWSYNTVQVNGLGQAQAQEGPLRPYCARVIAYTNTADLTYCAGGATYAYPHDTWLYPSESDPSGWLMPTPYVDLLEGSPLTNVTAVQRSVLMMRNKYFVVLDNLAASNACNWEWVWHVLDNTVTNLSTNGSFEYTSQVVRNTAERGTYNWNSVTTYVFQAVSPSLTTVTNMNGTNAYSNPVTGEHYWPDVIRDGPRNYVNLYTNYSSNGNFLVSGLESDLIYTWVPNTTNDIALTCGSVVYSSYSGFGQFVATTATATLGGLPNSNVTAVLDETPAGTNIIPAGATYSSNGVYNLSGLVIGSTNTWMSTNFNDQSITNGSTNFTINFSSVSGATVEPVAGTVTLRGTAAAAISAQLYSGGLGSGNPVMTNSIWVLSSTNTNQFHFLTVVYPVDPRTTNIPTFARLDDYTVEVQAGGNVDILCFKTNAPNAESATILVDSDSVFQ